VGEDDHLPAGPVLSRTRARPSTFGVTFKVAGGPIPRNPLTVSDCRSRLLVPVRSWHQWRSGAARGGVLVDLTGFPVTIAARLEACDGSAPPVERIRGLTEAYRDVFAALAGIAPIITADTTATMP